MQELKHICRNFGPVFDENSKILILGSFPSVKSRQSAFFYGHPQNRFWPLLSKIFEEEIPPDINNKTKFCLTHRIALWDVLEECDIIGSSDSSIRNAVPVDINKILSAADIQAIFCNGATSHKLYDKYLRHISGLEAVRLPSTSPANAACNMDILYSQWIAIKKFF